MDKTAFPATSAAGSAKSGPVNNDANIDKLLAHLADTSDPTSPSNGWLWWRTDDTTVYLLKARVNGTTVSVLKVDATNGRLQAAGNFDMDGKQLIGFIAEMLATAALPSNEGQLWYDSDEDLHGGTGPSGENRYWGYCKTDGTTYAPPIPCRMTVANLGTPATVSTATDFGGYLLDAAAEELSLIPQAAVPAGFTAAHDLKLRVHCLLAAAETASDLLDMDGDWITLASAGGNGPAKTATGFAAVQPSIGSANAQYDLHTVELTVDHDASGNVIAAGDFMRFTINHDATGQVAGIIVIGADLLVPVSNFAG